VNNKIFTSSHAGCCKFIITGVPKVLGQKLLHFSSARKCFVKRKNIGLESTLKALSNHMFKKVAKCLALDKRSRH
jgi:hypothetical protein